MSGFARGILRMDVKLAFGKALRQIRKARGMTQEAFEPAVVRTYISALERGIHSPTLERIVELATLLNVSSAALLTLTAFYEQDSQDSASFLNELCEDVCNWI